MEQPVKNAIVQFKCDSCGFTPITGTRYRCLVCDDFDLCRACVQAGKHNLQHRYLEIPIVDPLLPSTNNATEKKASGGVAMEKNGNGSEKKANPPPAPTPPVSNPGNSSLDRSMESGRRVKKIKQADPIEPTENKLRDLSIGPVATSFLSTKVCTNFLVLYEAGMEELTAHSARPSKSLEQLCGKMALCLAGVPISRIKKATAEKQPDRFEGSVLRSLLKCLIAQLDCIANEEPALAPSADAVLLDNGKRSLFAKTIKKVDAFSFPKDEKAIAAAFLRFEQELMSVWKSDAVPKVVIATLDEMHVWLCFVERAIELDDQSTGLMNNSSSQPLLEKRNSLNPQSASSSIAFESTAGGDVAQMMRTIEVLRADVKRCENRIEFLVDTIKECFGKNFAAALDKV